MIDPQPTVGIGHNQPPISEQLPIAFEDEVSFVGTLVGRAGSAPAKIEDEAGLNGVVGVIKDCRAAARKLDETRKSTKAPFHEAGKGVDSFFNALTDKLTDQIDALTRRVTDYNERVERERRRRLAEEEQRLADEARARLDSAAGSDNRLEQDIAVDEAERAEAQRQAVRQEALKPSADLSRSRTEAGTVSTRKVWTFSVEDYREISLEDLRPYLSTAHIDAALRGYVRAHKDSRPLKGVHIYQKAKANIR